MNRFGEWFGSLKQQDIMAKQAVIDLQKDHDALLKAATQKPDMSFWLVQRGGIQLPQTMLHLEALYTFAKAEPITRKTIETVRDEILRRGWEIVPKFKRKCTNPSCQKEFEIELDTCDEVECSFPTSAPDYTQRANIIKAKEFFKQVNKNDQSLMALMREVELDLEIVDDLWIILIKEYELDPMGTIFSSNIMEIVRGSPMQMKLVTDEKGTLGGFYWMCLEHREFVSQNIQDKCSHCGRALHEVKYVCTKGSSDIDAQYYFVDGEVIHTSKYSPSALYGFSPINTLWEHAFALIKMVNYIRLSYEEKRAPSGALAVPTQSRESFRKMMAEWDQMRTMNPTALPWFTYNPELGAGKVEFLKFTDTLEEMQFVDVRNEFADRVSYYYGVSRVFTRSSAAGEGSGLGNEGLDVTITHKAMESGQSIWNEQVFPVLMEEFGITDFKQVLKHPSEEKEMQEIERKKAKAELAEIMQRLNYDAILEGEDWKFVKREEQPAPAITPWGNGTPLANTPYPQPYSNNDWNQSSDYQTDATEMDTVQYPESTVGECPPGEHKHPGHTRCHEDTILHEEEKMEKVLIKQSGEDITEVMIGVKAITLDDIKEDSLPLFRYFKKGNRWVPKASYMPGDLNIERPLSSYETNMLEKLDELPVVEAREMPDGTYELLDGGHRVMLHSYKGRKTIKARIFKDVASMPQLREKPPTEDDLEQLLIKIYDEEVGEIDIATTISSEDFADTLQNRLRRMKNRFMQDTKSFLSRVFKRNIKRTFPRSQFEDIDKDVLDELLKTSLLWKSYENMNESVSEKINSLIEKAHESGIMDWHELVEEMQLDLTLQNLVKDETYRLERIARTESHYLSLKGQELGYKKRDAILGERNYLWIGPDDARTSPICKEIKARVKKEGKGLGVSMDQLKQIITEVAKKHAPAMQTRDWQPHINCRHTIRGSLRRSA